MKTFELCPHCEHEVKINGIMFVPQKCPHCGQPIKACSMCDWDNCDCEACDKKYPSILELHRFLEVFPQPEGYIIEDIGFDDDDEVILYIRKPDGNLWKYEPDMSKRPHAKKYLMFRRNDFDD